MEILVYLQEKNSKIEDFSYDLISYAKTISNGAKVSGIVVSNSDIDYKDLNKFGADKLYILRADSEKYDKRLYPKLILELIKKINPEIFILNSTTEGREIAPIVASSLNTGLTADCTKIEIENNKLISTRPTFGGKLMASILCKTNPQMATIRVNSFKKKEFDNTGELEVEEFSFEQNSLKTEILSYEEENKDFYSHEKTKIILAGGMGLKTKENFEKLKHLADLMGAKVGGTRKAVDKGLIEKEYQIGQTGLCVSPEIYIAFGISGAIHHVSGMENSKKIIAINTDKNAPIFEHCDIGVVCDANALIDTLIQKYSGN